MMLFCKDLKIAKRDGSGPGKGLAPVILFFLVAAGCGEDETTPVASPPLLETGADMVIQGMTHNITLEGVREGELVADTAFYYRDSTIYHLRNPELKLFVANTGVERARVTADRGRFNPSTREMLAQGNVILLITEGNKRIESQELNYNPSGDRIWSDSATVMREPGRVTEGMGFESDLDFRRTVVGQGSIRNTGGGEGGEGSG
jgi:LPS export ABC transporter protein LptC